MTRREQAASSQVRSGRYDTENKNLQLLLLLLNDND
jgi:hypothetical protein